MEFGLKQPLVGEKRCVTILITAAEETSSNSDQRQISLCSINAFSIREVIIEDMITQHEFRRLVD